MTFGVSVQFYYSGRPISKVLELFGGEESQGRSYGLIDGGRGPVAAMATQALRCEVSALFVTILIGGVLAEIVENVLLLVYYRRGF